MRQIFALLVLVLACRTPTAPTPPIPPQTPPPLPERAINVAHVAGRVVDVIGLAVDGPVVSVWSTGADCRLAGEPVTATGGMGGEFAIEVERGVGPEEFGCVVVEARAGGSSVRAERHVVFTAAQGDPRNRVELRLQLPRAPELTRDEGERLVRLLAEAVRTGAPATIEELDPHIRGDRQRVHAALDAYRQYLRTIDSIEFAGAEGTHWMRWRMNGVADRSVTTAVYRESLIELHGPLIDYGDRAAGFVRRILEVAHQGDIERMARVLTSDDEDVPLETAQRVIDFLRARFDLPRASVVLAEVDERLNVLRYRVSGPSREGTLSQEILTVVYGDGLVGLRGF
ncbi:MAG: hypothetical protein ACRD2J_08320 [Thermoanaerobaculia bacterium]